MTIELLAERDWLKKRVAELEAELAPIRALKVGSWQWAMVQGCLGRKVVDRHGIIHSFSYANMNHLEPFTLYAPPDPEPTAAELAAAIEAFRISIPGKVGDAYTQMLALASRVKRQEGGNAK